ncbi:MAG: hypothetical protein ACQESR_28240 [Planctomycetota bacterium]
MERCPTQAVLPLVGLAAEKVIRDRYIFQAVGFFRVESYPTQAVLPLVGLAAENVIRARYNTICVHLAASSSAAGQVFQAVHNIRLFRCKARGRSAKWENYHRFFSGRRRRLGPCTHAGPWSRRRRSCRFVFLACLILARARTRIQVGGAVVAISHGLARATSMGRAPGKMSVSRAPCHVTPTVFSFLTH